jgi:hypothetical protein
VVNNPFHKPGKRPPAAPLLARLMAGLQQRQQNKPPPPVLKIVLALFLGGIWMLAGVVLGAVAAFFVYAMTPEGPNRIAPALFVLAACASAGAIYGLITARKIASINDNNS